MKQNKVDFLNSKLVSVVITTYNRKINFLNRAIKSVLKQTHTNFELLVVDDNNSDSILRKEIEDRISLYKDDYRLIYISHDKNRGACAARNTGIKNSRGKYIAFLDDDDEWLEDKIEKQLKVFETSNVGLVYCSYYRIEEDYEGNRKIFLQNALEKKDYFIELLKFNYIGSTSFPLIKRECFENCGLFDEKMPAMQDYDMWIRIAEKYRVKNLEEPLVNYYQHKGDRISSNIKKKIIGMERLLEKHAIHINKNKEVLVVKLLEMAIIYAADKRYKSSIKCFFRGIFLKPFDIKHILNYIIWAAKIIRKSVLRFKKV